MPVSFGPTLSALKAFGIKSSTIANNVANLNTEGYKKQTATMVEGPQASVQVDLQTDPRPGAVNPEAGRHPLEAEQLSNVDPAEEFPQAIIAQRGYEANLKTVKARDEMMGFLLDIVS